MNPIRHVARLVAFRPGLSLLGALLKGVIFFGAPQAAALLTRTFFDGLTGTGRVTWSIWIVATLIFAATVVEVIFILVDLPLDYALRFSFVALVRRNMFTHVLDRPGARALPSSTGESLSRFQGDVENVSEFARILPFRVAFLLYAVMSIAVMLSVDPLFTAVVMGPMLSIVVVVQLFRNRITRYRELQREATGRLTGFIGDVFNAVQAVQCAGAESQIAERFHELNEARSRITIKDSVLNALVGALFANNVTLGTGLLLITAAAAIQSGRFTYGDLSLFLVYIGTTTGFSVALGSTFTHYRQIGVSLKRIGEVMTGVAPARITEPAQVHLRGALPEVVYPVKTGEHRFERLEIEALCYTYPALPAHPAQDGESQERGSDRHPVAHHAPVAPRGIRDISFVVPRGSFTVVTGRIGAGKTTLLRAILGLLPADAGAIRWNGEIVADPGTFLVPPRAAYTPQTPRLFSESLRDNILLGLSEERVDLSAALYAAVLEEDVAGFELGLDTLVGPKGVRLSGGQMQRAAAARMFVREAEIAFLDDLSSALDAHTESRLWSRLGELRRRTGLTCVAVSHRRSAFRLADEILVLREGELCGRGKLEALLETNEEMSRLWRDGNSEEDSGPSL